MEPKSFSLLAPLSTCRPTRSIRRRGGSSTAVTSKHSNGAAMPPAPRPQGVVATPPPTKTPPPQPSSRDNTGHGATSKTPAPRSGCCGPSVQKDQKPSRRRLPSGCQAVCS
ncbi:hypothetical protein ACP4OV_000313 [Aristida adscensionis]